MVVTDLARLSINELIYIAKREGLEFNDDISREEIQELLVDFYEENNISLTTSENYLMETRRFASSLLSRKGQLNLQLAESSYGPSTNIHLLYEGNNWVLVYWNISNIDKIYFQQKKVVSLIIRCSTYNLKDNKDEEDDFDVNVSLSDSNWSISLSQDQQVYKVQLIAKKEDGKEEVLCSSQKKKEELSWFEKNPKFFAENPEEFYLNVSALVTKDGYSIDNEKVKKILKDIKENNYV